ncbi:MAG: protein kinase domain-containing protein [Vicinamibacterales bacterium]
MHLTGGTQLGPYEVVEPLGRGGMGEVYRVRDRRLQREVALKIIHPELIDHDHLDRFRREARVLAALSHPNVATVHELDEIDGTLCLVMELVPGETLAERLTAGPLPVAQALRVAGQVAAALEAVHDKGIVHRDLKPSNIKVTTDGLVKVLDFGLAKMSPPKVDVSNAATADVEATRDGLLVGTAPYMSPEQVRGSDVDRRSDLWAFGCVLYEMLTGRPAFAADTIADTIAAIIEREPDWQALPPSLPPAIGRLLRRCLQRDPKRRLRDIGDARLDLEDALAEPLPSDLRTKSPPRRRLLVVAATGMLATGALAGVLATWTLTPASPRELTPARFVVTLPSGTQLGGLDFPGVAIAPDGSRFTYVATRGGQTQLFVRETDALDPAPLPGTTNAVAPFFSPDGRWIAFFADGQLKKVAAAGGAVITLCEAPVGLGGSWGPDDTIVFAPTTGSAIWRVAAEGGQPRRLTTLDASRGEFSHRWPQWLPDGETVLYTVGIVGSWNDAEIVAQSLETAERSLVLQGGTNPRYLPGHLLYAHDGRIMAAPFDTRRRATSGPAFPVLDDVLQSADGAAQLGVSQAGHAVFVAGGSEAGRRRLVSVSREGATTPFAAPLGLYASPRLSPDGRRLLLTVEGTTPDVWVYDIATGSSAQVTFDAGATSPLWTPDGQRAVFSSTRNGLPNLFSSGVSQPGSPERLAASGNAQTAGSWSPDGGTLAYVERRPATGRDILLLPVRGGGGPQVFAASPAEESTPRFSPDGRRVAYVSNETGRNEVYVQQTAGGGRRLQISAAGGSEPVWAPEGAELFYREGDRIFAVAVTSSGSDLRVGQPKMLFEAAFARGTMDSPNYDVTREGRFVMLQGQPPDATPAMLHVLLNWTITPRAASSR